MRLTQFRIEGLGTSRRWSRTSRRASPRSIDPRRDVDVYLDAARDAELRITHVLETHLHNDYVSGGRELAALTGAAHVIGAGAALRHDHQPARDGDAVDVGVDPVHGPRHAGPHARARDLRRGRPVAGGRAIPAPDRGLVAHWCRRSHGPPRCGERDPLRPCDVPVAARGAAASRGLGDGLSDPRGGGRCARPGSRRRPGRRSGTNGATTRCSRSRTSMRSRGRCSRASRHSHAISRGCGP
jgi:hypothetical protein